MIQYNVQPDPNPKPIQTIKPHQSKPKLIDLINVTNSPNEFVNVNSNN